MGNVKVQKRKVQFRIRKKNRKKIHDKGHEKRRKKEKKGLYRYRKRGYN